MRLRELSRAFSSLKEGNDVELLLLGAQFKDANVPNAINVCSEAKTAQHAIGTLFWAVHCFFPAPCKPALFPVYLKGMLESSKSPLITEDAIRQWHAATTADNMNAFPTGSSITAAAVDAAKESNGMHAFINYLNLPEEDDEDEEEEEE